MIRNKYDLENRLIEFSIQILRILKHLPQDNCARNLCNQISRSCTSPALNYGEPQAAESDKDFLHKMRICLKELRETQVCLKIIAGVPFLDEEIIKGPMKEVSELVAIFQKSIETKKSNMKIYPKK